MVGKTSDAREREQSGVAERQTKLTIDSRTGLPVLSIGRTISDADVAELLDDE